MTTATTATGGYTSSPPGSAPITPTPDNPGGYAKFKETRDDDVAVSNTLKVAHVAAGTGGYNSEAAWMAYSGSANSSLSSNKTTTVDVGSNVDTQAGSYTISGGKGEQSSIRRVGQVGSPSFGQSWTKKGTKKGSELFKK